MTSSSFVWVCFLFVFYFGPYGVACQQHNALSHGSTPANMICPSHSIIEIFVHSMDIDCAHEFVEVVDGRGGLLYRSSSADCKSDANTLEPLHSTTSTATFTFNRNSSHTPSYKLTWSCKSCGLFDYQHIIPSDVMSPVTDLYCISLDLSNPSNSITFADFGSKIVIPGLVNSTNRPVEWTLLSYFLEDDSVEETSNTHSLAFFALTQTSTLTHILKLKFFSHLAHHTGTIN
eukprot:c13179_g4_i3.p1 GENE.c13179_g4_i3~~c13179_g4_i3.p1  ORF type:complete len:232 (-),score=53.85 c13179_g4_i3:61-756(-)